MTRGVLAELDPGLRRRRAEPRTPGQAGSTPSGMEDRGREAPAHAAGEVVAATSPRSRPRAARRTRLEGGRAPRRPRPAGGCPCAGGRRRPAPSCRSSARSVQRQSPGGSPPSRSRATVVRHRSAAQGEASVAAAGALPTPRSSRRARRRPRSASSSAHEQPVMPPPTTALVGPAARAAAGVGALSAERLGHAPIYCAARYVTLAASTGPASSSSTRRTPRAGAEPRDARELVGDGHVADAAEDALGGRPGLGGRGGRSRPSASRRRPPVSGAARAGARSCPPTAPR